MARAPALVRSRASLIESWKWNIEGEERLHERIGEPRNTTSCRVSRANPPTYDELGDNADERIGEYQIGEIPRFGAKAPTHDELMGYPNLAS